MLSRKRLSRYGKFQVFACWLCVACAAVRAAPSERAREIMKEVENRALSDSQSYQGAVEVVDPKGKVQKRSWSLWREGKRGNSRILLRFDSPPQMRGVALLVLSVPNAPRELWLYSPSNQRDRRLTAQERSQRFMGTDLNLEDIEETSVEDFDYDLLGEESFSGRPVYKIKAVARVRNTQYSQLILFVRKDIMATTLVEYYVGGKLRKTLLRDGWQQIQGIWTPLLMEMKDLARGSVTRVSASQVKYNVKFEPEWFTVPNLRKIP